MEIFDEYGDLLKVLLFSFILLILLEFALCAFFKYQVDKKLEDYTSLWENREDDSKEDTSVYYVDIKGEVKSPNVYKVLSNTRVSDVIEKAGGLTSNASVDVINLSKKVTDEMVIVVYSKSEVRRFSETLEKKNKLIDECKKEKNGVINGACIDKSGEDASTSSTSSSNNVSSSSNSSKTSSALDSKISINSGSLTDLTKIPGIGNAKAKKIIDYRNANGGFKTIEDIKNVSGIGDKIYEKIKNYIKL